MSKFSSNRFEEDYYSYPISRNAGYMVVLLSFRKSSDNSSEDEDGVVLGLTTGHFDVGDIRVSGIKSVA